MSSIGKLMKQATRMQQQIERVQSDMAAKTVEATSGGGAVKVTAKCDGSLAAIKIDPAAVNPSDVSLIEDMVLAAEKELADTKAQIKAVNRQTRLATTIDEQHALQNKIRDLEKIQRSQRQQIFNVEDEIKGKRDLLIERLEKRLSQHTSSEHLFSIRWQVV